jgi:hypothetical protein
LLSIPISNRLPFSDSTITVKFYPRNVKRLRWRMIQRTKKCMDEEASNLGLILLFPK